MYLCGSTFLLCCISGYIYGKPKRGACILLCGQRKKNLLAAFGAAAQLILPEGYVRCVFFLEFFFSCSPAVIQLFLCSVFLLLISPTVPKHFSFCSAFGDLWVGRQSSEPFHLPFDIFLGWNGRKRKCHYIIYTTSLRACRQMTSLCIVPPTSGCLKCCTPSRQKKIKIKQGQH